MHTVILVAMLTIPSINSLPPEVHTYVVDHGLSQEDCLAEMATLKGLMKDSPSLPEYQCLPSPAYVAGLE